MHTHQTLAPHHGGADQPDDATYPFDAAPVALWDEDWSAVATYLEQLRAAGVRDVGRHFEEQPGALEDCIGLVTIRRVNTAARVLFNITDADAATGRIPPETITPAGRRAFARQFECMYHGGSRLSLPMSTKRQNGRDVDLLLHWSLRVHDGKVDPSRSLVTMTDITDQVDSERRLHELLRALSGIYRIESSESEGDLNRVLSRIVDAAGSQLGTDQSCILLFDHASQRVTSAVGSGIPRKLLERFDYATIREGLVGIAIDTKALVVSDDIGHDERSGQLLRQLAEGYGNIPLAASPVILNGEVVGVLATIGPPGWGAFPAADVEFHEILAAQAAVAIANARMFDSATQLNLELEEALAMLKETQASLVQAQKLESVGALAAGIAHEINTPIQYVGDNVRFLSESFGDLLGLQTAAAELATAATEHVPDAVAGYHAAAEEADIEFLTDEIPPAIDQTIEGVQRVAAIVRALKDFAHPGGDEPTPTDLNRALENTATVAKNEWKYVAELSLELDPDLPSVPALAGPLNQTFLIIIVNAAQAIGEQVGEGSGRKGQIAARTGFDDEFAEIRISDTGGGIPDSIRHRIFDPFFTTKEVGKGSGQGLSIARQVVVEQHGGTIDVEVEPGVGSTFVIRLPREVAT